MVDENITLSKWVCRFPFQYAAVFQDRYDLCCSDWVVNSFKISSEESLDAAWYGKRATQFRESILNGSYKYCNKESCPYLGALLKGSDGIDLGFEHRKVACRHKFFLKPELKAVQLCNDETCNLHCITCRDKTRVDKRDIKKVEDQLERLKRIKSLNRIELLGSGEFLASPVFRNWIQNFSCEDYPSLKEIHIHTNGQLCTKGRFSTFPPDFLKLINSFEVSIDASCKESYEKIRRGANWEKLQENLEYILSLPQVIQFTAAFVIQKLNVAEIYDFYRYVRNLTHHRRTGDENFRSGIHFLKLQDWGIDRQIWNELQLSKFQIDDAYNQLSRILENNKNNGMIITYPSKLD